jgi:hypothetical protein
MDYCFVCDQQIDGNVKKCPIYYVPKRLEISKMSLCNNNYVFKQAIADCEIDSTMTILKEQVYYLDEYYEPISKGKRIIFCSNECIYVFLNKHWDQYILCKSKPILYNLTQSEKFSNNDDNNTSSYILNNFE